MNGCVRWSVQAIALVALMLLGSSPAAAQSTDPAARVDQIVANALARIDKTTTGFEKKITGLTAKTRKTVDRMRYRNVDPADINDYIAQVAERGEKLAYTYRSKAEAVQAYAARRLAKYGSPAGRNEEVAARVGEHFDRILEVLEQLETDLLDLEV